MAEDLLLPQVPEPKAEDPEDVSWALSTAEAMWARGDHAEGIKWVRRAAEAASEAEDDARALELAKAAADLAGLVGRMSRAPVDEIDVTPEPIPGPPPLPRSPPAASRVSNAPTPSSKPSPTSVTKQVVTPSRPPSAIPLPSKASQPPPAPTTPSKIPPRALSTPPKPQGPASGRGVLSNQKDGKDKDKKGKRKSRDNFDAEAKAAGVLDTSPHAALDAGDALLTSDTAEVPAAAVEVPVTDNRVKHRAGPGSQRDPADATIVGRREDLVKQSRGIKDLTGTARSTADWDTSPTQNLVGDDLTTPDRRSAKPAAGRAGPPSVKPQPPPTSQRSPPSGSISVHVPVASDRSGNALGPMRPPSSTQHDPEIVTTQAVRVVVWRDATGVHVAPAGTVVTAITVDAVLVALDGAADLTAWLSQRDARAR